MKLFEVGVVTYKWRKAMLWPDERHRHHFMFAIDSSATLNWWVTCGECVAVLWPDERHRHHFMRSDGESIDN